MNEPKPWLEDPSGLPPGLAEDLQAMREFPVPYDATAGLEQLQSTTAATAGAAGLGAAKGVLLLVVVAGVGGLIALSARPAAEPNVQAPNMEAPYVEARAAVEVPAAVPAEIATPVATGEAEASEATEQEPTEPTEEPTSAETHTRAETGRASAPSSPEDEIRHLAELRRLSQSNPGRAVREANRGDVQFEGGLFAEERAAIRVFALERSGRHAAAARAGRRFLTRYPGSPQRPQIQEILR